MEKNSFVDVIANKTLFIGSVATFVCKLRAECSLTRKFTESEVENVFSEMVESSKQVGMAYFH